MDDNFFDWFYRSSRAPSKLLQMFICSVCIVLLLLSWLQKIRQQHIHRLIQDWYIFCPSEFHMAANKRNARRLFDLINQNSFFKISTTYQLPFSFDMFKIFALFRHAASAYREKWRESSLTCFSLCTFIVCVSRGTRKIKVNLHPLVRILGYMHIWMHTIIYNTAQLDLSLFLRHITLFLFEGVAVDDDD